MSFLIHSIANNKVVPMEYYPCATKAAIGTPMILNGALIEYGIAAMLKDIDGYPIYISMGAKTTSEVGDSLPDMDTLKRIPVIRVRDDIVFEAGCKNAAIAVGAQVIITAEGSGEGAAADYDYFVDLADGKTPQFEVIEVKEPLSGSAVKRVLIRYIG